ncbi:amiloride-sensitive sodium channel subunit delta-like isoform X2 [Polyodon spathula]|uniref:amiloride-sensitive sodium channel subunit delta-like isoform X2 n=1 Tax=Polyodon spathula TaxID=7913 RepID=UPI001B7E8377|nr:amiloride-sensitive sodium channel subunit delta-like isoform X2 [Polyodon spathula]
MPFPEDDGVNIPPGQESDLAIVKVHVHRLKAPYASKCSNGDGIHNYYRDAYKVEYTREACKKTCGQMHIINSCGCGMWEFPVPKGMNVPFCNITNKDINHCVQLFEDKFAHNELDCSCPLQCEEEIFELTLSSSQWPSVVYMDKFARQLKSSGGKLAQVTNRIRDNLVKVVINYQQLNYELIEEAPAIRLLLIHCWMKASPRVFHKPRSSAIRFHFMPTNFISSCRLLGGHLLSLLMYLRIQSRIS